MAYFWQVEKRRFAEKTKNRHKCYKHMANKGDSMSKIVKVNGAEVKHYSGDKEPEKGDNLLLCIPLVEGHDIYTPETGKNAGKQQDFKYYAKVGGKFGGKPIAGYPNLSYKLLIYPTKGQSGMETEVATF